MSDTVKTCLTRDRHVSVSVHGIGHGHGHTPALEVSMLQRLILQEDELVAAEFIRFNLSP